MVLGFGSEKTNQSKIEFLVYCSDTAFAHQIAETVAPFGHEVRIVSELDNEPAQALPYFTIIDAQILANTRDLNKIHPNLFKAPSSYVIIAKDVAAIQELIPEFNPISLSDLPAAFRFANQQVRIKEVISQAEHQAEMPSVEMNIEAAQNRTEYMAVLSHELRTPLAAINHLSLLLKNTTLTAQQANYLDSIIASTDMLLALIGDVLDFAQLEASKLELKVREFNLILVVEGALDLVGVQATRKNIDLVYTIQENTPTSLIGDPNRLSQVLINLLANSVKFTESGHVRVDIRQFEVVSTDNSNVDYPLKLLFEVSDTGLGIPKEAQGDLFKPFSQISNQGKKPDSGTGLGLIISKQLIQLMQGEIKVHSEGIPGKGSVFSFTIQCRAIRTAPPVVMQPNQDLFNGKRVCAIGKSTLSWNLMTDRLSFFGMQVTKIHEANGAIRYFATKPAVDMIIIDENCITLGEENALQHSIDELKAAHYLPVIVYTSADNLLRASMKPMTTSLLRRPFSLVRLFRAAEDALLYVGANTRPQTTDSSLNILIADDDPISRAAMSLHLSYLGYQADMAETGNQVLVALANKVYQLLIIDLHMGDTNGITITRMIRETLPAENQPLIAILTAGATTLQLNAMQKVGLDAYLEKPVSLLRLRQLLERTHMQATMNHYNNVSITGNQPIMDGMVESVDMKILNELLNISRLSRGDHAGSILDIFFQTVPEIMQQAKQAVDERNLARLKECLHALRGSCEIYGASRLVSLCKKLENEIDQGTLTGILEQVTGIESELAEVKSIVRTFQLNEVNNNYG